MSEPIEEQEKNVSALYLAGFRDGVRVYFLIHEILRNTFITNFRGDTIRGPKAIQAQAEPDELRTKIVRAVTL